MAILRKLPQQKTVVDLEARVNFFLTKTKKLQCELKSQKEDTQVAMRKVNKFFKVIWNIENYIGN